MRAIAVLAAIVPGHHGDSSQSRVLEDVRDVVRFRQGLRVMPEEEVFALPELADALRACGADLECTTKRLRASSVDLGLIATLNFQIDPPLVSLELVDAAANKTVASYAGGVDSDRSSIRGACEKLFASAGYEELGRITVEVSPPQATLHAAAPAEPVPGTSSSFLAPPGEVTVHVSHDGYLDAAVQVFVRAGVESRVQLSLEPTPPFWRSPWFWGGVGVAAVAATVILVALPRWNCLCIPPESGCVCPAP